MEDLTLRLQLEKRMRVSITTATYPSLFGFLSVLWILIQQILQPVIVGFDVVGGRGRE